jgi:NTP pyrophosphatase (non-canonical NTP hydrolase)
MTTLDQMGPEQAEFIQLFKDQQRYNFKINSDHGFEPEEYNIGEKIALMHEELSEALSAFRKDPSAPSDHIPNFTGPEEEFADTIIRIMCVAQRLHLRVAEAMIAKQAFNAGRPYKHGDKKF